MDNTPRNDILHPRGEGLLRRSYLPRKTPKVKYLPPAEAVKFLSGARRRCFFRNIKKPDMPRVSTSSCSRNVQIGTRIAISGANFNSLAAKQTWKAHQGSRGTWKPLDVGLKESESCVPNSNPIPSLNYHGGSVDSEQKAGSEIGRKKGEEMTFAKKAEYGMGQKKGKEVSFLRDSYSLGVKPREFQQQNFSWAHAENMANTPANGVMNPEGKGAVTRRNYIPPKTCKTKYIPPAEAVKLMPGTSAKRRRDAKKPNSLSVRAQNPKARPPYSRKVGAGSHPPARNGKTETPKPSGIGLKGSGSGSGLTKSELGSAVKGKGGLALMKTAQRAVKGKGGSALMKTAQSDAKLAHAAGKGLAGL